MARFSETMAAAMELAKEHGELHRQPGGYWTPPDEPMRRGKMGARGGPDRSAGTRTVQALKRRGLVEIDPDDDGSWWKARLTEDGQEWTDA